MCWLVFDVGLHHAACMAFTRMLKIGGIRHQMEQPIIPFTSPITNRSNIEKTCENKIKRIFGGNIDVDLRVVQVHLVGNQRVAASKYLP